MGKHIGRDVKIGIAKEVTRGTTVASAFWIPRRDFDFEDKTTLVIDNQSYGTIEDSIDVKVVGKYAEGKIVGIVRDKALGLLLAAATGTPATTSSSPEAGCYTHVYQVVQSHQHPSLSINVDDPNEGDLNYVLAMMKSLEINATVGEYVVFSSEFISKTSTPGTVTAAYVSENAFTADGVSIKFADTVATLGTATATKVKSVVVRINKNVEKADILGSVDPDDIMNKSFAMEIDVERYYEDTTFKTRYRTSTPQTMRVDIQSASLAAGATYSKLTIDLNKVKITDWKTSKDLDNLVIESFTVKANFSISDAKMLEMRLINAQISY
jgi:hypothetical protein